MKTSPSLRTYACVFLALCFAGSLQGQTLVFSENFSNSTLTSNANPYLGGWFGSQVSFQTWNGPGESSISNGALTVNSTSETRSAGLLLAPSMFPGAGSYTLSFDVTAYTGDSNDMGLVNVWAGSGYDLTKSTGNALILDMLSEQLRTEGSATSSLIGSTTFTSTGNGKQITFNYDGSSAVGMFFGVNTKGWPFPSATFDNITLTQNGTASVPEPSVTALVALFGSASCFIRRRRA